jgi:hypothetical protein
MPAEVQVDIQKLMTAYDTEIGSLRGQALRDRVMYQAQIDDLQKTVTALQQELVSRTTDA